MKKYNDFGKLFAELEKSDSYWAQKTIVDFSVELHKLMRLRKLSKKQFSQKLGTSQAYITKVFKGDANFTIDTMVKLVRALNGQMKINVCPAEEKNVHWCRLLKNNQPQKPFVPKSWASNMEVEPIEFLESAGGGTLG